MEKTKDNATSYELSEDETDKLLEIINTNNSLWYIAVIAYQLGKQYRT